MRVSGLSVVGIIVATLVFYAFEFFWYGITFQEAWQTGNGLTSSDFEGGSPLWMGVGFLAPLLQVIGLALILKWCGWPALGESIKKISLLSVFIGAGVSIYVLAYMPLHSTTVFLIDWVHIVIGWFISAIILTFLRPRYIAPVKHNYQAPQDPEAIYED